MVWEVNEHRLVIADTLIGAARIYEEEYGVCSVHSIKLVSSSSRLEFALTHDLDDEEPA